MLLKFTTAENCATLLRGLKQRHFGTYISFSLKTRRQRILQKIKQKKIKNNEKARKIFAPQNFSTA